MFSVIILDFDGFLNKKDPCIQNGVFVFFLQHKFEKSLEIWHFSVFLENPFSQIRLS